MVGTFSGDIMLFSLVPGAFSDRWPFYYMNPWASFLAWISSYTQPFILHLAFLKIKILRNQGLIHTLEKFQVLQA